LQPQKKQLYLSITQPSHMRQFLPVFLFTVLSINTLTAQNDFRPCGTDEKVRESLLKHPEFRAQREELEAFTRQFSGDVSREIKVIPVVFHIMHNYGPENISKEQVEDAIRILNEDYQLLNTDQNEVISAFSSIVANVGFEFRLARKDPNGNCTDGITRTVTTLTFNADDNVKELISWPRNKYLNVWVVDNISFGAGGYAYLPGSSNANDDGIVILNTQLGSIGTSGGSNFSSRSLTHEVGHWFNLLHTWGDTNSPGVASNCNADDNVSDTPNTIGVSNQSCNLSQSTCGSPVDNVQNYMDYSTCAKMFTNGQKNRMLATANSSTAGRNNLWSANNLVATGVSTTTVTPCAPIADFSANATSVCSNSNITFTDLSYNADVDGTWDWNWSFPGGTPSSSALQNPVVSYNQPGSYTATLTVSNSTGNNSVTKTSYLLVSTSTPTLVSPVIEGFETASFPQNDLNDATHNWRYDSPLNNAFSRTNLTSASGSACLKYNNLQIAEGTNTSLVSPVIDFSSVTSPTNISFKVAYARRSASTNDKLEVWISSNCGQTWTRRYAKLGATLATTSSLITSSFTPSSTQWRTETVSVTPLAGEEHGMVKFTVIDSSGNNLYLDDINLVNTPAGITEILDEYSTQIFPNPGSGDAQVNIGLFTPEEVSVSILDVTGRLLGTKNLGMKSSGEHTIWLRDISGSYLASGAYFIRIEAGNQTMIRKWIGN